MAKELGISVKNVNSKISDEDALKLSDYCLSGKLPEGVKKASAPKERVAKTSEEKTSKSTKTTEKKSVVEKKSKEEKNKEEKISKTTKTQTTKNQKEEQKAIKEATQELGEKNNLEAKRSEERRVGKECRL